MLSVNQQNFSKEVLESSQLVLVHFWAPWCGLCRLLTPTLTKCQAEWGENLKIVGVNADDNFKLATTYRLKTLPTIIIFKKGLVHHRLEGFQGREQLRSDLENILVDVGQLVKSA